MGNKIQWQHTVKVVVIHFQLNHSFRYLADDWYYSAKFLTIQSHLLDSNLRSSPSVQLDQFQTSMKMFINLINSYLSFRSCQICKILAARREKLHKLIVLLERIAGSKVLSFIKFCSVLCSIIIVCEIQCLQCISFKTKN